MQYFFVPLLQNAPLSTIADVDWATVSLLVSPQSHAFRSGILRHASSHVLFRVLDEPMASLSRVIPLDVESDYVSISNYLSEKTFAPTPLAIDPSTCEAVPMHMPTAKSCSLLPSIIMYLDGMLLADELRTGLRLEKIHLSHFLEAMTCRSRQFPYSMGRLRFLGSSFLTLMANLAALTDSTRINPNMSTHVCLAQAAQKLEIDRYLSLSPHSSYWRSPFYLQAQPEPVRCDRKTLSFAVGAIVGAAIVSGGEQLGIKALISLGLWADTPDV
ncbi:Dicer-like protein 1 [Entomophthora muscae]|uniref:Dicer-like protein 1 n=2 Tax=Entomophthora muscae TaxID=34485 RepID=A0ACC2UQA7_9FUNG|nr:Dicer-like protein 1 [Entomophthora muscae]KAJ9088934.1 Dicer-like protein 1 [Entomophthora muscae]